MSPEKTGARDTFVRGAIVLTVAAVITKAMGAVFRIPLINIIGADGMAYYQAVYPIYSLFLMISNAGFPIAISRMTSERLVHGEYYEAHRVFKVAVRTLAILGGVLSIALFGLAGVITGALDGLGEAAIGMRAIAPTIFFVSITSAYIGYFQGMNNMRPTAVKQITEQFFRVIAGITLAIVLLQFSKPAAAAGATSGATIGGITGLIAVLMIYSAYKGSNKFRINMERSRSISEGHRESVGSILKTLFIIAIPIVIGSVFVPVMDSLDVLIVSDRLAYAGFDDEQVRSMYGQLSGMSGAILNLPMVLMQSIAISLLPVIVAAYKSGNKEGLHHNVRLSMRFSILIAMPCAVGIGVLAEPILKLLYPMQIDDAIGAAPSLTVLSLVAFLLSLNQTQTSILQGVGHQIIPVRNMFIGLIAKVAIAYTLVSIRTINIVGSAIGSVAAYTVAATMNAYAVKKYTGTKFPIGLTAIRPLISSAAMGGAAFGIYAALSGPLGNSLSTIIAILVAALIYVILIFALRAVTREDLVSFPKGDKLLRIYDKLLPNKH
jgi:stage V sporulation protein B